MAHSVLCAKPLFSFSIRNLGRAFIRIGALCKAWRLRANGLVNYQRIQNLCNHLEMRQSVSFGV